MTSLCMTPLNGAAPHRTRAKILHGRVAVTERLYYSDAYCREFDATVQATRGGISTGEVAISTDLKTEKLGWSLDLSGRFFLCRDKAG